jgi:hypothetical protein
MRPLLFAAVIIGVSSAMPSFDALAQNVCIPRGPDAQKSIPRLDRALLIPPPKFDCELKATGFDGPSGQMQASLAGAEPSADAAARVKLDYALQCHRHAEMILRDRLRQLQAAVGETIKAVDRRAQPAVTCRAAAASAVKPDSGTLIPLPDRALLTPAPEFDCEFKSTDLERTNPDAAPGMKLDYELQCRRHAEMIVRNRLQRVQASVGETIKAVGRSEHHAVKPQVQQPQPPQPEQPEQPEQMQQPEQVQQPEQLQQPQQRQQRLSGRELARALQSGGFVIVHRYTETTTDSWPPVVEGTIDTTQRISPQGRTDAQALGEVYRRLKIPVAQVLSSQSFVVYQTATAAFGDGVKLHRDLTGLRAFNDPVELKRSLSGFRSRVATRPPAGTNVVLWTHEGKFMKAFGHLLAAGDTVVFGPAGDRVPREVARLSLRQFLALAD